MKNNRIDKWVLIACYIVSCFFVGYAVGWRHVALSTKKTLDKCIPVAQECVNQLETAADIIKSGQYCEQYLNQVPEMCLSVCLEQWAKYGC